MAWSYLPGWLACAVFVVGMLVGTFGVSSARWLVGGRSIAQTWQSSPPWAMICLIAALGALLVLTYASEPHWWQKVVWAMFWLTLLMMTATDLETMRVPNRISLSAAVVFIGLGLFGLTAPPAVVLAGAFCTSGLLFLIHWVTRGRGMGLGDVKLYLSIGAMLGPLRGVESLLFASAFASVCAGMLMVTGHLRRRDPFPFVPYIFAGVVVTVFLGPGLNAWYGAHLLRA